jgi:uncharacterized membrane protein (Fun14 family)
MSQYERLPAPIRTPNRAPIWATLAAQAWASLAWAYGEGPYDIPSESPTPPRPPTPDGGEVFTESFFLTLGFSFFVGLAAGYALKVAFKIALLLLGVALIGTFVLQYNGLVDVNWSGVEAQYDLGASWLQTQGTALLDFMGRNLASGASFVAGLVVGLRL